MIIFLFVPLAALNSFIIFRRKKLNLSEHSIVAGMLLLGILLFSTLGNLLFYFDLIIPFSDAFANGISLSITILIFFYIGYGYFNAFGKDYSKLGITYRIVLFFVMLFLEIILLFFILFGFVTDWKFGKFVISPFG